MIDLQIDNIPFPSAGFRSVQSLENAIEMLGSMPGPESAHRHEDFAVDFSGTDHNFVALPRRAHCLDRFRIRFRTTVHLNTIRLNMRQSFDKASLDRDRFL